ncbi:hypothetical protein [Pedobacter kyonggii]|uniref:Uncharacterized protein n=1 Tax=Pedobacter kyonggii TaxID=1926871 RepID=A0A4Q9HCY6_9SPHI|nr:hypothetical protein [Pedobacter kyonggii]TBO41919.1 hypothetical protein EYS08_12240 [Pedobacter kyonggii]
MFLNPIGTDADFPSKLAGGKAGLKLPRTAALSFSNHKEIMLKMSYISVGETPTDSVLYLYLI